MPGPARPQSLWVGRVEAARILGMHPDSFDRFLRRPEAAPLIDPKNLRVVRCSAESRGRRRYRRTAVERLCEEVCR